MAAGAHSPPSERPGKSSTAFRTISEVAEELDVPQHVLRFWETKFSQVRPLKRGGGRRYYRPEDIDLLRRIRELLYSDGYTIKGVQRLLRERGARAVVGGARPEGGLAAPARPGGAAAEQATPEAAAAGSGGLLGSTRAVIEEVLQDLEELRDILRGRGGG